jgi:nicotinamidase-related amidase
MPDRSTALIVTDMLSTYRHEDADRLAASAREAVPALVELIASSRAKAVPVIFVNDNYGDWNTSAEKLYENALGGAHPELVEPLLPKPDDALIIKARHSAFYTTPLEYLLRQAEVDRVLLAGQVTEQCILYSALDAYVRHFEVAVARDAVAHIEEHLAAAALEMIEHNMRGELVREP